jgi:hypothetical protein
MAKSGADVSGAGTVTATGGGTLELANTVTNIGVLQVNSGSRLKTRRRKQRRDRHRHGPGCGPALDLGGRLRPDCHQSAGGGRRRHPTARS